MRTERRSWSAVVSRGAIMLSSLIVTAAVVLASSSTALAQCPCVEKSGNPKDFICSDTSLTYIPDCVYDDITSLWIETPSIPLITENIKRFTSLEAIHIYDFSKPQMTETFLKGQTNLTLFSISGTSLDYVDNEWFLYSPNIKTLDFSQNDIASLAADTFSSLPLLENVYLALNKLTILPPTLFQASKLKNLQLDNNPWHCDCELATLMQWTRDNHVYFYDSAICSQPRKLKGLNLNKLTPDMAC